LIKLTSSTRIFCAIQPADFRKGIDGLNHYCQTLAAETANTKSGALIVFINRARTMVRVLSYDGTGFWLATKRLSKGRFTAWPTSSSAVSSCPAEQLMKILQQLPHSEMIK